MKSRNYNEDNIETKSVEETPVVEKKVEPKEYIITVDNLALRIAPNGKNIGVAKAGHTFVDKIENGFGRLTDGSGWVMMSYLREVD